MHAIPTRRLFVYIAMGLVVLVVGTLGLLSTRGGADPGGDEVVIGAGGPIQEWAGGSAGDWQTGSVAQATTTTSAPRIWVQVAGAVRRPGVYQLAAGARVFEAVLEAGGFTGEADQQAVALAAKLGDGCRVYVPCVGEVPAGTVQLPVDSSAGVTGGPAAGTSGGSSQAPVSINSATLEQLDALPGIGPALAQQIITYRETQGPFTSVEQLTDVPGIGAAKLEQLRPLVGL